MMTRGKQYALVTGLTLVVGAVLRLYHLTADTPNYFAGLGQALMTDPYHITIYARNKVLFGSWEIFDYHRWVAFKVSLVSGFAWLVFSLGGVSRFTANLTAVLLNLFATSLLVAGVFVGAKKKDANGSETVSGAWLGALVAALLLSLSHVLLVYAREPFLEHGLLLIAAACFLVSVRCSSTGTGAVFIGVTLALAPLAGKLFGLILLAPVAVTVLLVAKRPAKQIAVITASALVTAALWYLLILGDETRYYHAYLQEQSMGLYGFPPALTSFKFFFIQLFSYGAELRLFQFSFFMPVLLLFGFSALFTMRIDGRSPWTLAFWRDRPALTFLTVWFVSAWLSLMIFQYRPLRYSLFVLFPALGVIGCLAGQIFSSRGKWGLSGKYTTRLWQKLVAVVLLYIGLTIVMTQVWLAAYGSKMTGDDIITVVGFSALFSAPTLVALWLVARALRKYSQIVYRYGLVTLILLSVLFQGYWYYRMASNLTFDMITASQNMENALAEEAVLTGPYAPNLTIDNHHKNIIYTFGLKYDDTDLFSRFPITHLVGDYGNLEQAYLKFPQTKDNYEVSLWMFRSAGVTLNRLGESFPHMVGLPETALEKSDRFLRTRKAGSADSAVYYGEMFLKENPGNRAAKRQLFQALLAQKSYTRALELGKELVEENPTDCLAMFSLARSYFYLGKYLKQERYNVAGAKYLERALKLNPASEKYLRENARKF